MSRKYVFAISIFIFSFLTLCNLLSAAPTSAPPPDTGGDQVAQAIAQTQLAQTQIALIVQLTAAAAVPAGPLPTYTFQPTYTEYHTVIPLMITVSVSVNTNCRTGPGTAFPIVGALAVGQTAEVVGRSASSDNWIIRLPGSPSVTCWLWGQYATVVGNTVGLPVYTPPPTPTAVIPTSIVLTVHNSSVVDIWYFYFDLVTDPWTIDRLGADEMNPGDTFSWTIAPGVYDLKAEKSDHSIYWSAGSVSMYADTYINIP
jgi:hypothetical protein